MSFQSIAQTRVDPIDRRRDAPSLHQPGRDSVIDHRHHLSRGSQCDPKVLIAPLAATDADAFGDIQNDRPRRAM